MEDMVVAKFLDPMMQQQLGYPSPGQRGGGGGRDAPLLPSPMSERGGRGGRRGGGRGGRGGGDGGGRGRGGGGGRGRGGGGRGGGGGGGR